MVDFEGQYTYQQFVAARELGSGLRRPFRLMLWPIISVIGLALTTPMIVGGPDPANLIALAIFLAIVSGVYVAGRYRSRRAYDSAPSIELSGSADSEGIRLSSGRGSTHSMWSDFYKATVSRRTVLLFHSTELATFIPREFFSSDADWAEFVRFVRAGVKGPPLVDWRAVFGLALWIFVLVSLLLAWALFSG